MTALELEAPTEPGGARPGKGLVRRHPTRAAALACLVSFTVFWVAQRLAHVTMLDLMVYRAEGFTVRNGESLYDMVATSAHLPNTYPPFAALLFTPLTLLGVPAMRTLATAGNLLLLVAVVHLSLRLVGRPAPAAAAGRDPRRRRRCWCGASRYGRRCATARSTFCSPRSCCGT